MRQGLVGSVANHQAKRKVDAGFGFSDWVEDICSVRGREADDV